MYHIFFIQSSVNGHLGCFHVLAIVTSAAMNISMDVSFLIMVFSRYMPRNGIAGSYGSSVLSVLRQLHFFLIKNPKMPHKPPPLWRIQPGSFLGCPGLLWLMRGEGWPCFVRSPSKVLCFLSCFMLCSHGVQDFVLGTYLLLWFECFSRYSRDRS